MLAFHPQMFVRIVELDGPRAPVPRPLQSGFLESRAYRVVGVYNPSETSDAYFILPNDQDELWFICQRHLRFAGLHDTAAHHLDWPCSPGRRAEGGAAASASAARPPA
ncbi:hypothetical protein DEFR109230_08330 [Deinococcus frigens]